VKYVNRLSDLLFVAARYANDEGKRRSALEARREPLMRGGIHHVDLTVKDAKASRAFYESVLGFMGYTLSAGNPFSATPIPTASISICATATNSARSAF
jgi:hypothetical protein